jgi:Mg2+ and Co2+ transporter CorA
VDEREDVGVEEIPALLTSGQVIWIDVCGLGDEPMLRRLAEIFDIHPLALEDVVNVPQRPKAEAYDQQHLVITRMAKAAESGLDEHRTPSEAGDDGADPGDESHGGPAHHAEAR